MRGARSAECGALGENTDLFIYTQTGGHPRSRYDCYYKLRCVKRCSPGY